MKRYTLLLGLVILVGCKPLLTPAPAPTPRLLRIGYHPALKPWAERLSICADYSSTFTASFYETASLNPDERGMQFDLLLKYADPLPVSGVIYQFGSDRIAWIVHLENPIQTITMDQFTHLLTGEYSLWSDISPNAEATPIELWVYPLEDALSGALFSSLPSSRAYLTQAMIAPNPQAMLEAVASHPDALGFIPESWLTQSEYPVKLLPIEGDEGTIANLDIVAITPAEASAEVRSLLLCARESSQ